MFTKSFHFKNFEKKKIFLRDQKNLKQLLNKKQEIIKSLSSSYKSVYNKKKISSNYKKYNEIRLIGMGGSILGAKAIHDFLRHKIKKNFHFIDNLEPNLNQSLKKNFLNIVISKSGNTLETIANFNVLRNKGDKNIFITENKKSNLRVLAKKLRSEIIDHNNFIGGRYSVLSEVGMLPAEFMGLNPSRFRQLNYLIKNKLFLNSLIYNVGSILSLIKKKKMNSIFLNYDSDLTNLLEWYKQLMGESLGKKSKGILPLISNMPKDNHSVMQYYLDGPKKNFFTFFSSKNDSSMKIKNIKLEKDLNYLKNKSLSQIVKSQKIATEKVFKYKKIPFRSFEIFKKNEKTLGELFIFFILETILLGKALNVNPYDQPSVELIKTQTKKLLIK